MIFDLHKLTHTAGESIGFLSDVRRMNVALTRARLGLYVIGNSTSLSNNPHWAALISSAKKRGLCMFRVLHEIDELLAFSNPFC